MSAPRLRSASEAPRRGRGVFGSEPCGAVCAFMRGRLLRDNGPRRLGDRPAWSGRFSLSLREGLAGCYPPYGGGFLTMLCETFSGCGGKNAGIGLLKRGADSCEAPLLNARLRPVRRHPGASISLPPFSLRRYWRYFRARDRLRMPRKNWKRELRFPSGREKSLSARKIPFANPQPASSSM